jgi:tRNA modification GTPase
MASGELSRRFEQVRNVLLSAIAQTEAMLDFSDVEDAGDILLDSILHSVREAEVTLDAMLRSSKLSERLRNGLNVVIAGPPNVGKSTLLNFLAQRDIAIVSPFPGTTRDTLEIAANLSGFPVNFVDTAGIRDAVDPVEMEGVARAIRRCASADLILWLSDSDGEPPPQVDAQWPLISVRTKADLLSDFDERQLYISAKNGRGIDALLAKIIDFAQVHFSGIDHATLGTERQIDAAEKALTALRSVIDEPDRQLEFLAEDLRIAAVAISRITGRIEVDEVLNEIFSRLCVGK